MTGSHFLLYAICDAINHIEPCILGFISRTVLMVSAQRVSPTGPGALSVGRQAFPPTVSKELHNVIWNPVAEA
jgi:hypothetical protein